MCELCDSMQSNEYKNAHLPLTYNKSRHLQKLLSLNNFSVYFNWLKMHYLLTYLLTYLVEIQIHINLCTKIPYMLDCRNVVKGEDLGRIESKIHKFYLIEYKYWFILTLICTINAASPSRYVANFYRHDIYAYTFCRYRVFHTDGVNFKALFWHQFCCQAFPPSSS